MDFQLGITLVVASHLLACWVIGVPRLTYVAAAVSAYVLLFFLFRLALSFFGRGGKSDQFEKTFRSAQQAVDSLSLEEARREFLTFILDKDKFICIEKPVPEGTHFPSMGPITKDFFSRYEIVKAVRGEMQFDRTDLGPSSVRRGFIRIGKDIANSEIVVAPGSDAVLETDGTEETLSASQPTIYHYIVMTARLLYSDELDIRARS